MKKSSLLWLIPVVLILAAGGYFIISRTQSQAAKAAANIQTVKLEQGTISAIVDTTGSVRTNQSAQISWQTSGKVNEVKVELGDQVKANDVLALLEPASMRANIIQAQADLASAQQALDDLMNSTTPQAQALQDVQDAQTALDNYNNNFPVNQAKAYTDMITATYNLTRTVNHRNYLVSLRPPQADIDAAGSIYRQAKQKVDSLQQNFDDLSSMPVNDRARKKARHALSTAQEQLDAALTVLTWYMNKPNANDIANADTDIEMTRSDVAQAQDAWNKVKDGPDATQLAILKARLTDTQRKYERVKNGPSETDIQSAKARIVADQATLSVGQLAAPFDGTITEVDVMVGDLVKPGDLGYQIDDVSSQYVDLQISEVDINKVELGQPATLTFDGVPGKQYNGQVDRIGRVGKINAGAVDYVVSVKLTDADSKVRSGMTASASIVVGEKQDVLLVPSIAIRVVNNQTVIDVRRGGQVTQVVVQTGLSSDTQTEILSGDVKAGDEAVVSQSGSSLITTGPTTGGGSPFGGGGGN
jgi:HlyD family secretion protein